MKYNTAIELMKTYNIVYEDMSNRFTGYIEPPNKNLTINFKSPLGYHWPVKQIQRKEIPSKNSSRSDSEVLHLHEIIPRLCGGTIHGYTFRMSFLEDELEATMSLGLQGTNSIEKRYFDIKKTIDSYLNQETKGLRILEIKLNYDEKSKTPYLISIYTRHPELSDIKNKIIDVFDFKLYRGDPDSLLK